MAGAGAIRRAGGSDRPRIAVAASGGLDSTALLHCVHALGAPLGVQVHALHVDHGLHDASAGWCRQLRRQCARWARGGDSLVFHAARLATRPARGDSVEAWARRERYAALARLAAQAGCGIVLLAHHRRDQAETVLLQALRGAGPAGLAAMPKAAERDGVLWLRPWLDQPRERIESYVKRWRLSAVEDPANEARRYARNRVRHDVLPALRGAFDDAETALLAVAARAQEAAAVLGEVARADAALVADGDALVVARWLGLGAPRRANVLRWWLAEAVGGGVPESLVQRLLAELPRARAARWPAGAAELQLYRGRLVVAATVATAANAAAARPHDEAAPSAEPRTIDLSVPGDYAAAPWPGRVVVEATAAEGIPAALLRHAQLRPRRGGERFQRHAESPPRSLKKQYQQAGVPAWQREGPLVFAGERLLYVPGLGADARVLAAGGGECRTLQWRR